MDLLFIAVAGASLAALCGFSFLGILHPRYEDTVTQRVGMSLTAFCSFFACLALLWGRFPLMAFAGTLAGCAIYAFGVVIKHRRRLRAECSR